eukprot:366371-Chlamydomonas_euryale.AAC.14
MAVRAGGAAGQLGTSKRQGRLATQGRAAIMTVRAGGAAGGQGCGNAGFLSACGVGLPGVAVVNQPSCYATKRHIMPSTVMLWQHTSYYAINCQPNLLCAVQICAFSSMVLAPAAPARAAKSTPRPSTHTPTPHPATHADAHASCPSGISARGEVHTQTLHTLHTSTPHPAQPRRRTCFLPQRHLRARQGPHPAAQVRWLD